MSYDETNIFARILRGELPAHKVFENDIALAFMDVMPRADGHVLVIPKAKARNLLDIPADDLAALMPVVQRIARAAKQAFAADGITLQQFSESAGGQVVFHLHFHIIPRLDGVPMRPHTGEMEKPEVLAANAEKLRRVLEEV